jgi:hypothetical protein
MGYWTVHFRYTLEASGPYRKLLNVVTFPIR